jgi:hypothetical protein
MNPPPIMPSYQMSQDAEHLKLLVIFYYISSGLSCLGGLFGIFYAGMGLMFQRMESSAPSSLFLLIGVVIIVISLAMAVGSFLTARWLSARKNKTFCMVIAGFSCLNIPLGTALGVFTFIVLSRPSVSGLFDGQSPLTTPHA